MIPRIARVIVIVLDGAGAGALPDADQFGDGGANTLGHVVAACHPCLPNLQALGLGSLGCGFGLSPSPAPRAALGLMAERSPAKDSTVGHWELLGVVAPRAYPVYPEGFPAPLIREFSEYTGRPVIGNRPASGTRIIRELYDEHRATGAWIVYTSGDSVFQVAAHVDVVPVEELHACCQAAADRLIPRGDVLRVIARPFRGQPPDLQRTSQRRDYNAGPPGLTLLDRASAAGLPVVTVGKVDQVLGGRGITEAVPGAGNAEVLRLLRAELETLPFGLLVANLVDFDMLYGHRRDAAGFSQALEAFDEALGGLLAALGRRDVLVITADHGCDPTAPGSDHTREYVPLLVAGECVRPGAGLGVRPSFADLGATLCEALGLQPPSNGSSFWPSIAIGGEGPDIADQRADWLRRRGLRC
jgi:phosphopentomutase